MVWRQLPKLVPAGSIPVSCSKYRNILVENYRFYSGFLLFLPRFSISIILLPTYSQQI